MGVGRGYGGARIDLENLSTTDPHSRQLLAAQIIWTLSRAGINGPYVINADGAALDDRFADGWETSDVAATDPGAADGAAAGLHALVGGSLVCAGRPAGATGGGLVRADARSDGGRGVAHRPGGGVDRDAAARRARHGVVAVGRSAGRQSRRRRMDGRTLSRPTWSLDDAIWVVVDGNNVVRVIQDASGQPGRIPVDSTAVSTRFPGADRRPAAVPRRNPRRDGDRGPGDPGRRRADAGRRLRADLSAAAGLRARQHGGVAVLAHRRRHRRQPHRSAASGVLRQPRRGELRRPEPQPADAGQRCAANPSTVYVADARGVLQLSGSAAEDDPRGRRSGR